MPAVPAQAVQPKMLIRIYVPLALLIALIAFAGFWRTYFGPMSTGSLKAAPLIHMHAAVYVTWLALFIAQAACAATGRLAVHTRLGPWIMAYGVVVIVMGLVIAFEQFGIRVAAGDLAVAQRRIFGPLRDVLFFAPFLAAGWVWRRRPELHKRVMVVATSILLVAAVGRMAFLGQPIPEWKFMVVWPLPLYVAMIHDFATKRIVHPVYVVGVLAMLLMRVMLPLRETEAWLVFTRWLATFY